MQKRGTAEMMQCRVDYYAIRAIPHKSSRESGERFFVRKRWKTAGILCVFQGFTNEFLAEKIRQNPQTHLCGVALSMPVLSENIQKIKRTKLLHRYNLPFDGNSCEKSGFARRSGNNPFQTDTVYLLIAV